MPTPPPTSLRPLATASDRRRPRATTPKSAAQRLFYFFGTVFSIFLLFGGSGAPAPLPLIGVEVVAVAALAVLAWRAIFVRAIPLAFWPGGALLLALAALAVIQLIPLPFSVWTSLPGRDLAAAIVREAGLGQVWMPLSLAQEYTLSAFLTLLPAVAVFLWAISVSTDERVAFAWITLAVVLLSAALGVLQLLSPESPSLYFSPRAIFTHPSGIFANRNFQSDFLLIGILLSAALSRSDFVRQKLPATPFAIAIGAFLSLMVIGTGSRFGFVMLGPTVAIALLIVGQGRWTSKAAIGAGAGLSAVVVLLAVGSNVFSRVLDRFSFGPTVDTVGELRFTALPDLVLAMQHYFPLGAGLGTFDPVYRTVESLELVGPQYFNHAHDDYIELVIETGLLGPMIVLLYLLAFLPRAYRILRSTQRDLSGGLRVAAVASVGLLLIHSTFDYPLRNVTLECVFAFFSAVVFSTGAGVRAVVRPGDPGRSNSFERSPRVKIAGTGVLALTGLALAALIVQVGLGRQTAGNGLLAHQIRAQNPRGTAEAAEAMLLLGKPSDAIRLAREAIQSSPLNAQAVRVLGMGRNRIEKGTGDGALLLASQLSWRDRPTQAWVLEKAIFAGEAKIAMLSAEALARVGRDQREKDVTFSLLRILAMSPSSREALTKALAGRPIWRHDFLFNDSPMTPEQLAAMAALLKDLDGTAAPPSLGEARAVIDQLVRLKKPLEAYALYQAVAPAASRGGDAGFSRDPADYEPGVGNTAFDWRLYESDNAYGTVEQPPAEADQALYARAGSGGAQRIADRIVTLDAGQYQLSYRRRSEDASSPQYFTWSVRCNESSRVLVESGGAPSRVSGWEKHRATFSVPTSGCASQTLQLATSGGPLGSDAEVYFDDVSVAPAKN